jgi:chromatin modification-related protein VID21
MHIFASTRHRKIARIHLLLRGGADIAVHRTCNESRKRKLRELYKYTVYLDVPDKWASIDQPSENEARFLNDNDIEK